MDAVAGLLDGPRARGAFLLRSTMDPPWSLRIEDEAPLTLVAVVRGEAWIVPDGPDSYLELINAVSRSSFAVHFDPVNIINSPRRHFENGKLLVSHTLPRS